MKGTLVKAVVSLVALFFAFYNLDLTIFLRLASEIEWPVIALAVVISLLSVAALGVRWHQLLSAITTSKLSAAIVAEYVGLFGNNVFPLRLGEILRARYMATRVDLGFLKILATIFLERLFDLVIVGGVVGLLLLLGTVSAGVLDKDAYLVAGVVAVVAAPVVAWAGRPLAIRLLISKFGQSSESTRWIDDLLRGRTLLMAVALSFVIWLVYAGRYQTVLLGIGLPFDVELVALLIVATVVGFMIPAAPGAIGTYHLAVVFSMHNLYGVPLPQAQLAAILLHLTSYLPSTLIGCLFFIRSKPAGGPRGDGGRLPQVLESTER